MGLLRKKVQKNKVVEQKERHHYETLSPTKNSKAKETINMLEDFLQCEDNINIALSGRYGAGKTSILKTFFNNLDNEKYNPLYVSLGMFGINKNGEILEPCLFCQEIEKSIIQQIIYKEKPSKLPDSNIKRIAKISKTNIFCMAILIAIIILVYLLYLYQINMGDIIKSIIKWIINIWNRNKFIVKLLLCIDILTMTSISIGALSLIVSKIWRKIAIKSYKFKLPNTELEINENSDESLISKYMDELVYFFSKTNYDIVVIEDLDRFLENEEIKHRILIIFQKLKELSFILNDSKQVNKKIRFIYAVRDDLFKNETERTKFFDAIVPVIPIVSNFNSYAELKLRLNDEGILDKVIQDISAYIDDYRLIKNLCNEYYLYKVELGNKEIANNKIFSMIALKNIRPNLYEELLNNNGQIYKLIKNKYRLYDVLKIKLKNELEENNKQITQLEKEKIENFYELKLLSISGLYGKSGRYGAESITSDKFLQDNVSLDYIRDNTIYIRSSNGNSHNEEELFAYFNGKSNFIKRAEKVKSKNNNEIEKIKNDNIQLESQINQIDELALKDVLKELKPSQIKKILINNEVNNDGTKDIVIDNFVLMLVSNGYVDENYKNYMFKFKETAELNSNDYTYIINVRQGNVKDFYNEVDNPKQVISQLDLNYFSKKEILNHNVLEELISNKNLSEYKEKLDRIIKILLKHDDENNEFVFGFLKFTKNQGSFFKLLYDLDNNYFKGLILYNMENEDRKEKLDTYVKILLNNPQILKNNEANIYIKQYVESKSSFESYIELNKNVKESLVLLNVKFNELQEQKETKLMDFIYNNNLYINNENILSKIFKYKGYTEEEFQNKNLSHILNDETLRELKNYVLSRPKEYIEECYLKTNNTKNEAKDIFECINMWVIENEVKNQIIKNMPMMIENINDIVVIDCDDYILDNNRLKPTWENLYSIYLRNGNILSKELINYIETNSEKLINEKINDDIKCQDFNNFLEKIARNNDINYEIYIKLLKVFSYIILNTLQENEIKGNRLKILVENDMIKLSPENLNIINNESTEVLDIYIKNNIDNFINDISQYNLDECIVEIIISSVYIKPRYKTIILENIDLSLINLDTMRYIILNYSNNNISRLKQQLKKKVFNSDIEQECKVLFLTKELYKESSLETVKDYIVSMPEPYNLIGKYELRNKSFSIANNKCNMELLDKLIKKGLNFSYNLSKTNKKIIINNKKTNNIFSQYKN